MREAEESHFKPHFPEDSNRRRHRRYAIELNARFVFLTRGREVSRGSGCVVNLSPGGVLFESAAPVAPGRKVELTIDWPAKLDGRVPLQLRVLGKVVRAEGRRVAAVIERYEFRTAPQQAG